MPYARTRKTTSPGCLNSPIATEPQLTGRTRRVTLHTHALRRIDKAPRKSPEVHRHQPTYRQPRAPAPRAGPPGHPHPGRLSTIASGLRPERGSAPHPGLARPCCKVFGSGRPCSLPPRRPRGLRARPLPLGRLHGCGTPRRRRRGDPRLHATHPARAATPARPRRRGARRQPGRAPPAPDRGR